MKLQFAHNRSIYRLIVKTERVTLFEILGVLVYIKRG